MLEVASNVYEPSTLLELVHASFAEELLFRGVLLRLFALVLGTLPALVGLCLIWVALHQRPRLFLFDVGVGLALGGLALKVGLWAAILAHLLVNVQGYKTRMGV